MEARAKLESLVSMGFSKSAAAAALIQFGGDVRAAAAALGGESCATSHDPSTQPSQWRPSGQLQVLRPAARTGEAGAPQQSGVDAAPTARVVAPKIDGIAAGSLSQDGRGESSWRREAQPPPPPPPAAPRVLLRSSPPSSPQTQPSVQNGPDGQPPPIPSRPPSQQVGL